MDSITADIDHAVQQSAATLTGGGARLQLLDVAAEVGRGEAVPRMTYSVTGGVLSAGPNKILSAVSSLDDARARIARHTLESLVKDVSQGDDVQALRKLHRRWEAARRNLVDALEDIALRRLPAGRCRWCPGTPAIRLRSLPVTLRS